LLFLLIVGVGSVVGYIYYQREKNEELREIQEGICPHCKQKSIVLSDERGAGCGPKLVTFTCTQCGYQNSFSMNGGCGL
jgi:RNase P subunit RPR2